jgi:peptidoglycan/xylan/chitin deacetylase (PgdA/CDA1 family)
VRRRLKTLYRLLPDRARSRLKSAAGYGLYRTGLYRVFFRGRAVVFLFHRVDDALAGNALTCTSEEFAAYCDFLRRYFEVVTLGELVRRLTAGEDVGRCAVITFDDGYLDNSAVAAPVLEQRGLPACFFIATNFIGSSVVPWWDAELSIEPAWMSWEDVRSLADRGFEIGAHTMDHVDLGVVNGDAAREQIVGARERIAAELGREPALFSYPYGRAHQLTEANREQVRDAGFACCLSAFGGCVRTGDDPFRLQRFPVSPSLDSGYHLGFEALLQLRR